MWSKHSWSQDVCSSSSVPANAGSSAVEYRVETQPSQSEDDESRRDRSTAADDFCDCLVKTNCKCGGAGILVTLKDPVNTAIESIVIDSETTYENKFIALIETWKACKIVCDHLNGTHVFVHFAASESALLIFDPRWINIPKNMVFDFILILRSISKVFEDIDYECCEETLKRFNILMSIVEDPWGNIGLANLLNGRISQDKVIDFLKISEQCNALRLKLVCAENCETEALRISSIAVNFLYDNKLIYCYHKIQDFEFIKDVYHGRHIQCIEMDEISNHLKEFISRNNSKVLMKVYASKIYSLLNIPKEERPRICDDVVVVCKMMADILVAESLRNPYLYDDFSDLITIWIAIMSKLMESNYKQNMDISCLKDTINKFIEYAESSRNLYLFYDILHEKFGSKLPLNLYLEIYVKALCNNINEKEAYKYLEDVESSMNSVTELIQGYLKLADILENVVSVSRECVLTAFSLRPSENLMHQIQQLAIKSGKLYPDHVTNVSKNSYNKSDNESTKNNNYNYAHEDSFFKICSDLNNLPDPLTPTMQYNLISMIRNPRYGPLNWNLKWPEIKSLCQEFLECSDTMNRRHILRREDLMYVDMDIEQCNINLETHLKDLHSFILCKSTPKKIHPKKSYRKQKYRGRPLKEISIKKNSKATSSNIPKVPIQKQQTIGSRKSSVVTNDLNISNAKKKFKLDEKVINELPVKKIVNLKECLQTQKSCGGPSQAISSQKKLKATFQSAPKIILSNQQTIGYQNIFKGTSDSNVSNAKNKLEVDEKLIKELTGKEFFNSKESVQTQGRPSKAISSQTKSNAASQNIPKVPIQKQQTIGSQKSLDVINALNVSNAKNKFKVEEKGLKELLDKEIVLSKKGLQEQRVSECPLKAISITKKSKAASQNIPKDTIQKQQTIGSQKSFDVTNDLNISNANKKFKVEQKVVKELPGKEIVNLKESLQRKRGHRPPSKAISSQTKSIAASQSIPKVPIQKQQTIGSQKSFDVSNDLNISNTINKFKVVQKVVKKLPGKEIVNLKESLEKKRGRGLPSKAISSRTKLKAASQNIPKDTIQKQQTIGSQKSFDVTNDFKVSNVKEKFNVEKGSKESHDKEIVLSKKGLQEQRIRESPFKAISIAKELKAASQIIQKVTIQKHQTIGSLKTFDVSNDLNISNAKKKFKVEQKVLKELPVKKIVNLKKSLEKKRGRGLPSKTISSQTKLKAASQNIPKVTIQKQQTIGSQKSLDVTNNFNVSNVKEKFNVKKGSKESHDKEIVLSKKGLQEQRIRESPFKATSITKESKAASQIIPKVTIQKQQTIGSQKSFEVTNDLNISNANKKFKGEQKVVKEFPGKEIVNLQESLQRKRVSECPLKAISITKKSKAASQNIPKDTIQKQQTIGSQKSFDVTNDLNISNAKKKFKVEQKVLKELPVKKKSNTVSQNKLKIILPNQKTIGPQKSCKVTNDSNSINKFKFEKKGLNESSGKEIEQSTECLQKQSCSESPLKVISIEKKSIAASQNTEKVTLLKQNAIESQKSSEVTSDSEKKIEILEKVLEKLSGKKIIHYKAAPMYYKFFLPNGDIVHVSSKK